LSHERPPVGRLAPSPTGALHLGNARSFLLAWLSIRLQGGTLLLRIEDIDSPRVKPWTIQHTIDTLRWLGLDWDHGPDDSVSTEPAAGLSYPIPLVQSHRIQRYQQCLDQLISAEQVYRCYCSRKEVEAAASAPHESRPTLELDAVRYPGTCRSLSPMEQKSASGRKFAWRMLTPDTLLEWQDGLLGPQQLNPSETLGDFVLAKDSGLPAYQLAVVVDDFDMQVSEVVRGNDLILSTFRQRIVQSALGLMPPEEYYHLPLMIGPDGRRLAKRHGDTRVSSFRELGVSAEALIGYLSWTSGLIERPQQVSCAELLQSFDQMPWERVPVEPTVVDEQQATKILKSMP